MFRYFICLLIFACLGTTAIAGPWLRGEGKTFTAVSSQLDQSYRFTTSTFIEYGATPELTLGVDIKTIRAGRIHSGSATAFLRRPFGPNDRQDKFAYQFGTGAHWNGRLIIAHLTAGLSWGRGLSISGKEGWTNLDAEIRVNLARDKATRFKMDGTIGLNVNDRFAGMFQVFMTHTEDLSTTVSSSIIYTPRHEKFRLQFAVESPIKRKNGTALKISMWRDF